MAPHLALANPFFRNRVLYACSRTPFVEYLCPHNVISDPAIPVLSCPSPLHAPPPLDLDNSWNSLDWPHPPLGYHLLASAFTRKVKVKSLSRVLLFATHGL